MERSDRDRRIHRPSLGLLAAAALLAAGCPESWQRPSKPPASALWIAARSVPLESTDLAPGVALEGAPHDSLRQTVR